MARRSPWALSAALAACIGLAVAPSAADQKKKQDADDKAEKEKRRRVEENRRRRAAEREKRVRERILQAQDLEKTVEYWVPDITSCYKKHALSQRRAKGMLYLEVLVEPTGRLRHLEVVAPGVRGSKLRKCIEPLAAQWVFPQRKGFTKATIPFRFLHTKGAGPIQSCWSKRGCSSKRRGKRTKAVKPKAPPKSDDKKKKKKERSK